MNLTNLRNELEQKRGELANLWAKFDTKGLPDGTQAPVMTADDLLEFKNRTAEIDEIGGKLNTLEAALKAAAPSNPVIPGSAPAPKATGIKAVDFSEVKNGWKNNWEINPAEFKTSVTAASSFAPESTRTGEVVPLVYTKPNILDYLPLIPWNQQNYTWMAQTTRTNSAAAKAEVTAGDESTVVWTETFAILQKIVGFLPVSEYALTFAPELRRLVEVELFDQVREKWGYNVLLGDGNAPNLRGLNNLSAVGSEALGANPRLTAFLNAMVGVMADNSTSYGGANPNLVVINPLDWQQVVDTRTSDGIYIYGNPVSGAPATMWGMRVLVTGMQTSGTGLVLDSNMFAVPYNQTGAIEFTNSHGELFAQGQLAFRSTIYSTLVSKRDKACWKVTGI